MVPTSRQIGRILKRTRQACGLSRYALAKRAGIDGAYVTKLEEGRSNPTVGMLGKLAKALDVPYTHFLGLPPPEWLNDRAPARGHPPGAGPSLRTRDGAYRDGHYGNG
jgi:transcriptional regulator with XRE-family HTH domain